MKTLTVACLVAFLLAAPAARADEPSPADRYHEAYVLEVIEGKVPDASRIYLELFQDETTPADVRAEARLRFALCTVLLGRPDEARLQLRDLLQDGTAPESTKARARAALESIAALGAGSELDKKLQELVFDLARVSPAADDPPVYRDFEVLGKRALPFLRGLLEHEDASLAQHAFRLLVRMDEPDMAARWTPRIGIPASRFMFEWIRVYLDRHPEQLRLWEQALLKLDARRLPGYLVSLSAHGQRIPFSIAFVEAIAGTMDDMGEVGYFLRYAGSEAERWALVERWLTGEDEGLRNFAGYWILEESTGGPTDEGARRRWPTLLALMEDWSDEWSPNMAPQGSRSGNLLAYLRRLPAPTLLDALERSIDVGEERASARGNNPLVNGLAGSVAKVLDERSLESDAQTRYDAQLKRWLGVWRARVDQGGDEANAWSRTLADLLRHVALRLEDATDEQATAFLTWLFEGPARGRAPEFAQVLDTAEPRGLTRLTALLEAVGPEERAALVQRWPAVRQGWGSELRQSFLANLPRMVATVGIGATWPYVGMVPQVVEGLPREVRQRHFEALLDAVADDADATSQVLQRITPASGGVDVDRWTVGMSYFVETALPALERRWSTLSPEVRKYGLELAWRIQGRGALPSSGVVTGRAIPTTLTPANAAALLDFLTRHVAETPYGGWKVLLTQPDLLPLELWVPLVPDHLLRNARTGNDAWERLHATGAIERVARELSVDPAQVNDSVLAFVRYVASEDTQQAIFDALLRSPDAQARRRAIGLLGRGGRPASPEALEAARQALLAEAEPEASEARQLAQRLVEARPSAAIFPLVRLVLASAERYDVLEGIGMAKSLGQEELVGDLVPFLDSMDKEIRDAARDAIQAIREVTRIKTEAATR